MLGGAIRKLMGARNVQPAGYVDIVDGQRIVGWAWNPQSPLAQIAVEFVGDGRVVHETGAEMFRQDLLDAGIGNGCFGFDTHLPEAALGVDLVARVKQTGKPLENCPFRASRDTRVVGGKALVEVRYEEICARVTDDLQATRPPAAGDGPLISILTPVYNVAEVWLQRAVESVQRQSYRNWQLCLVDDASTDSRVRDTIARLAQAEPRITSKFREANGGIAAATNSALLLAHGEYVALLDNDDMLTCNALEEMVKAIKENDAPDYLYSDECLIDEEDRAIRLFPKPDWSPLLMLNCMYTGHFSVYRKSIVESVGGFRSDYDFSQDYDLMLRVMERTSRIVHVEEYLYGWRMIAGSAAADGKPEARLSNIAALQAAVDRRGWNGKAIPLPSCNRVVRPSSAAGVRVSIVIPSDNADNIAASVESIRAKSTYADYEIVVVTNSKLISINRDRFERSGITWAPYDRPYNFSDKCNVGAGIASGSYLFFYNDDVRVITPDWIEVLLEYLTLPGVGAVSPKLLYENGLIQHAGMLTGVRRLVGTTFHCLPADTSSHFNFAQSVREVSLLSGALLGMPLDLFHRLGGFDAVSTPISHSDVDLCLRVQEAEHVCVYVPHASLTHIGHFSLGEVERKKEAKPHRKDKSDIFLLRRFGKAVARDKYFPQAMRDVAYGDSQEPFSVYPGTPHPHDGEDALILTHDLSRTGAPKVAVDVASMLKEQGQFVVVVSPEDGPHRQTLEDMGITVIIDPLSLQAHPHFMDFAKNFDKVIANTALWWRAIVPLQKFTTVYWYIHETDLLDHIASSLPEFAPAVADATGLWAGSEYSAERLRVLGGRASVLEYGVDDVVAGPDAQSVTIGLFGSFEPRKGQDLAVLGLQKVAEPLRRRVRLKLMGRTLNTGFWEAVQAIAADVEEVEFGGETSYRGYFSEFRNADIIIVPSRADTLPLVSLDALMFGKPLICSRTTGTSMYLVHGESALILEHNSPDEIAEMITLLLSDPTVGERIGNGGRGVFERFFTRSAFKGRMIKALGGEGNRLEFGASCASL